MFKKALAVCAFSIGVAAGECSMVIENIDEGSMGKHSSSSNSNKSCKSEASTKALSSDITQFNTQQQSKSVEIKNKDDFLKLDETAIKNINELKFEGIELDEEFLFHSCKMVGANFQTIEFHNCKLTEDASFSEILDGCNVENLSIKNCSITTEDLSDVLLLINPYLLRTLDISNNHLGKSIVPVLQDRICERISLQNINIEGNNLQKEDIAKVVNLCRKQKAEK